VDELLTVAEVSKILKVHKGSVYRWVYDGRLECTKVGRSVRFTEKQVEDFLAKKNFTKT